MNKKLKCAIAVVLVLIMAMSAFVVFPATAASTPETASAEGEVFAGVDFSDEFSESIDLAPVGGDEPSAQPTVEPTVEVDGEPTEAPTQSPTEDPTKVGPITTITRTTASTNTIGLAWNVVSGATGYRVFWRDADVSGSGFTLLSTVKDTKLTIRNLKAGAVYAFKISAYKNYEGRVIEGSSMTAKAATTPSEVKNFRLTSGARAGTGLKWSANSLCDGYILYREEDCVWSRIKVLGKDVTEFKDTNVVPGKAYYYRICTYRKDVGGTLKSAYSNVKTVCGLCAPADNGTKSILRRMNFKWKKNAYATGYEIYYSGNNKDFTLLVDTKNLYYNSNRFKDGKKYYFRIYPYRLVGKKKTKVLGTYLAKTITITNSAYGKTVPKTYIEVSLDQQHMWYYINDEIYVSTDVVTGNYGSMDTPKGYWRVNNKAHPCTLVGAGYVSYVDYWMSFIGGSHGIHDASWRSTFGGTIYKGNGSHGCINTPFKNVKKMYAKVTVGTPVIVY